MGNIYKSGDAGVVYVNETQLPVLFWDKFASDTVPFDWGYNGTSCLKLSYSILYNEVCNFYPEEMAKFLTKKYGREFLKEIICFLPDEWELCSEEITLWLEKKRIIPSLFTVQT